MLNDFSEVDMHLKDASASLNKTLRLHGNLQRIVEETDRTFPHLYSSYSKGRATLQESKRLVSLRDRSKIALEKKREDFLYGSSQSCVEVFKKLFPAQLTGPYKWTENTSRSLTQTPTNFTTKFKAAAQKPEPVRRYSDTHRTLSPVGQNHFSAARERKIHIDDSLLASLAEAKAECSRASAGAGAGPSTPRPHTSAVTPRRTAPLAPPLRPPTRTFHSERSKALAALKMEFSLFRQRSRATHRGVTSVPSLPTLGLRSPRAAASPRDFNAMIELNLGRRRDRLALSELSGERPLDLAAAACAHPHLLPDLDDHGNPKGDLFPLYTEHSEGAAIYRAVRGLRTLLGALDFAQSAFDRATDKTRTTSRSAGSFARLQLETESESRAVFQIAEELSERVSWKIRLKRRDGHRGAG
eukprot:gnl/Chilomastix_cuspidata/5002.p1 GENE.gnl/Chilomastix_cuspidata/5002~~gnl/Chilomastix_cuspidata/5002.p1  ORF type:complete len:413 (-),score=126.84 gnl/Chilomastix_cuspidata/5002:628-1866(-)